MICSEDGDGSAICKIKAEFGKICGTGPKVNVYQLVYISCAHSYSK